LEHTDFLVLTSEKRVEDSPLILYAFSYTEILALVDHLLTRLHCHLAVARNLRSRRNRPVQALLRAIEALGRESPLLGLRAAEVVTGEDELHGLALADRPRQSLAAAGAGYRAQFDLGLAEVCARGAVHDVGHHGELAAAAERVAVDGADDGLLDLGDHGGPHFDEVGHVGLGEGEVLHLLDVGAGREGLFGAGDDDGADLVVLVEFVEGIVEFEEEGGGERVQGFGPVEGDYRR